MGKVGITLSTVDPAAANMFNIFMKRGFAEEKDGIFVRGDMVLVAIPL